MTAAAISGAKDCRRLVERFIEAYNAFNIEVMLTLVHTYIEFRHMSDGQIDAKASGIDAFRRLAEASKAMFESRHQSITAFAVECDRVLVDIDFVATLATDLPSGMRRGDTIRLSGRSEYTFRDGKIIALDDIGGNDEA